MIVRAGDELPSVAVYRHRCVNQLFEAISNGRKGQERDLRRGARSAARGGAQEFVTLKTAADIFNKWVFRVNEAGNMLRPHALESAHEDGGWVSSGRHVGDPVIPSSAVGSMHGYLREQLKGSYVGLTNEAADAAVVEITEACHRTARKVEDYAKKEANSYRRRGVALTDRSIGVACIDNPRAQPGKRGDDSMIELRWIDPFSQPGKRVLSGSVLIYRENFDQLVAAYHDEPGTDPARVLSRIFVMIVRYETLFEAKSGHQAALPPDVFQALHDTFGVRHECFASPLNKWRGTKNFCSVFPDVDSDFGSRGSFFDLWPKMGSFEVNPPFDQVWLNVGSASIVLPLLLIVSLCAHLTRHSPLIHLLCLR